MNQDKNQSTEPGTVDLQKMIVANDFLMEAFAKYAQEHQFTPLELFMSAHNFHKDMVYKVSRMLEITEKFPREKVFREADLTFRAAMKDLKNRYYEKKLP